jgi:hypothetical protein
MVYVHKAEQEEVMRAILSGGVILLALHGCATVDLGDDKTAAAGADSGAATSAAAPARPPASAASRIPVAILGKADSVLPVLVDGREVTSVVAEDELEHSLATPDPQGPPSRILIDTTGVVHTTSLVDPKIMADRRRTGEKQVDNPEYARAQEAVREAEQNLREAEEANTSIQNSSKEMAATSGVGAWGAVLGSATAVMGVSTLESAKQRLKDARSHAAATKPTTGEPTYEQVDVAAVTERTTLAGEVRIYQLDARTHGARLLVQPVSQVVDRQKKVAGTALIDAGTGSSTAAVAPVDLKMADLTQRLGSAPAMDAQALAADIGAAHARARAQASQSESHAAEETAASRDKLAQLGALSSASGTAGTGADAGVDGRAGATAVGASGMAGSSASGGEDCHMTAAFLGERFPPFSQPMLENVRTKLLAADLHEPMENAKKLGKTPQQVVEGFFETARNLDASSAEALKTAAAVDAVGTTDEEFMAKLKDNSLQLGDCEAIRSSSLCMAAMYKMSAVFYRAMAAELTCHIRNGSWSK